MINEERVEANIDEMKPIKKTNRDRLENLRSYYTMRKERLVKNMSGYKGQLMEKYNTIIELKQHKKSTKAFCRNVIFSLFAVTNLNFLYQRYIKKNGGYLKRVPFIGYFLLTGASAVMLNLWTQYKVTEYFMARMKAEANI